jgi:hypothetical protein
VLAGWLFHEFERIGGVLILIVVALFIAAGLNPASSGSSDAAPPQPRGDDGDHHLPLRGRPVPLGDRAGHHQAGRRAHRQRPEWFDQLQRNRQVQELDDQFDVIDKVRDYVQDGNFATGVFGGVLGVGLRVLGALANAFVIIVLTLYFLSSLETTKHALYRLAPASRRERVGKLATVSSRAWAATSPARSSSRSAPDLLADLPVRDRPG